MSLIGLDFSVRRVFDTVWVNMASTEYCSGKSDVFFTTLFARKAAETVLKREEIIYFISSYPDALIFNLQHCRLSVNLSPVNLT